MKQEIELGFKTFVSDGAEEFGAVRAAPRGRREFVIYVENARDFAVPLDAVESVHSEKVILNYAKLDDRLRRAIRRAHDSEKPVPDSLNGGYSSKPAAAWIYSSTVLRGAPEAFIGMLDGKTFGKLIVRIGPDDAKQQDIDLIKGVSHAAVATDGFW